MGVRRIPLRGVANAGQLLAQRAADAGCDEGWQSVVQCRGGEAALHTLERRAGSSAVTGDDGGGGWRAVHVVDAARNAARRRLK